MNLSALPELLLAWVKTQGAALLQGNKGEQAAAFKPGANYDGKVLDQLPGGRHLVQVGGQKLDMGLPRNTQAGDTLRLTFLNAGPRPTFLLHQSPVTPVQQVQLSNTAQQVGALMRIGQAAAQTTVQSTGQTNAAPAGRTAMPTAAATSMAQAQGQALTRGMATVTAQNPAATPGASQLASPLANPVASPAAIPAATTARISSTAQAAQALPGAASPGMPAQQAAMAARPIVANVVMLQGYAATAPAAPTAVASANTALAGQAVDSMRAAVPASTNLRPTVVADPAAPSANLLPTRLAQALRESGLFYESHLARWTRGSYPFEALLNEPQARLARAAMPMPVLAELGGMSEEAARMAGRQLHMLEGGPFLWQGFAWPGQWMAWLVQERQGGEGDGQDGEAANQWSTELSLTLPAMGPVHAQLALRGQEVSLRLQVEQSATAQALREALPRLRQGLETSGLRPVVLAVDGA